MRIAIKELLRQPGRFTAVGGALTLLVVLLVVLGGFLDGLELDQTGAYRAHEGRLLVFAADSDLQIGRSRIPADVRDAVAGTDGVQEVGTLDQVATTVGMDGEEELEDVVVFGYELPTDVLPEPAAGAVVDAALVDLVDVAEGDVLQIGPDAEEVEVVAIVGDLSQGAPTIWLPPEDWRRIATAATPTGIAPDGTAQALVVQPADVDTALAALAQVDGVQAVTPEGAIEGLPVVQQQSATFAGIIGVTFAVTLLVVALFFALLTLERTGLYAVLKALGGRSSDLVLGVSAQAVLISAIALVAGVVISLLFTSLLPAELPIRLEPARLLQITVGVLATALLGSLSTLRRILRIDPAEAIG